MTTMVNKHASRLAHQYWDKLSPEERSARVPKNGGRPRIYPQCPVRKKHRFVKNDTCCWCGFVRPADTPAPVEGPSRARNIIVVPIGLGKP